MAMADGRGNRFASTTEAEQQEKRLGLNAQKTLKANRGAAKLFKEYLSEKGSDPDFENFGESVLDQKLSQFYMDLRKTDGRSTKSTRWSQSVMASTVTYVAPLLTKPSI